MALLEPEALKIINGRKLTVLTSHDVSGILNSKVNIWMTDSRLLKYQSLLLEGPLTNYQSLVILYIYIYTMYIPSTLVCLHGMESCTVPLWPQSFSELRTF